LNYREYVALGDSMSIDLYPALDAGETDVAVALEWDAHAGDVAPLGAASLLYRNVDDRYPEFMGRDLISRHPGIRYRNLAEDGATIGDVFGSQVPQLEESDEPTLLTLSIGGNDLLLRIVKDIADGYEFLVDSLTKTRPNATVLLTTVYDPSDDTRKIPGFFDDAGLLPLESLHELNGRIRAVARNTARVVGADVYRHFLGHGVTAAETDRWYWRKSIIEPNAPGASEIRRVWLDALDDIAED
jgi:lysophospholipase L1-like esterase